MWRDSREAEGVWPSLVDSGAQDGTEGLRIGDPSLTQGAQREVAAGCWPHGSKEGGRSAVCMIPGIWLLSELENGVQVDPPLGY